VGGWSSKYVARVSQTGEELRVSRDGTYLSPGTERVARSEEGRDKYAGGSLIDTPSSVEGELARFVSRDRESASRLLVDQLQTESAMIGDAP